MEHSAWSVPRGFGGELAKSDCTGNVSEGARVKNNHYVEKRTDVYVSTLASYIEAMGGELEIRAVFADGTQVKINQFMNDQDRAVLAVKKTSGKRLMLKQPKGAKME